MMKSSLFILSLLKSDVSAVYYPEAEGACPFKAGALDSNVKASLNAHRLAGPWVNLYDRKILNDEYKCYGVNFIHTHSFPNDEGALENEELMADVPKVFEYLKSTNVGESRDPDEEETALSEVEQDQPMIGFGYNAYNGFQLHFDHASDKSIAYLRHRDVDLENNPHVHEHDHEGEKEEEFDAHVFDSQFKRYA